MPEDRPTESASVDQAADALHRYEAALHEHREHTKGELAKMQRAAEDAIEKLSAKHAQEKDEMEGRITELTDWRQGILKAEEDKAKVVETSTTIVVPPKDVVPDPEQNPAPSATHAPGPDGKPRRRRLSWW